MSASCLYAGEVVHVRRKPARVAEDVRMSPDKFGREMIDDVVDGERSGLSCNLAMKDDLKQHVAQFLLELRHVLLVDGLQNFVGFFEQIGLQGLVGLFPIPRTSVRRPEGGHEIDQF